VVFRRLSGTHEPATQAFTLWPKKVDATAVEGFGTIALSIGARLKLLLSLAVQELVERQVDVSTSIRFRTVPDLTILTCEPR
jgi:hypothetical protein